MRSREWVYLSDMTLLASELGQLGMRSLAKRVLNSVVARAGDLPQRSEQADILISCARTAARLRLRRWSHSLLQNAVRVVRAIENPDEQVGATISAIRACFQLGDPETAHALMNWAIRQAHRLEGASQASTLTVLASFLRTHDSKPQHAAALLRRARRIWRTLPSPEHRAIGLLRVAHQFRDMGMHTLAARTLIECARAVRAVQPSLAQAAIPRRVFADLVQLGHLRMAYAVLRQTEQTLVGQEEGISHRIFLLRGCASVLAEAGYPNQARRLFAQARAAALQLDDTLWRVNELQDLAQGMREAGLTGSARFSLRLALRQARQIANLWQRALALYGIALTLIEQKRFDEAKLLLLESLACIRGADGKPESHQVRFIARALAEVGVGTSDNALLARAVQTAQELSDARIRLSAFLDIARVLAGSGQASHVFSEVLDWAYDLTDSLESASERAWNYLQLARLMRIARQRSQAKRAMQAALEQIHQIEPPSERAPLLAGLGACLVRLGDKKQAEALMEQALALIPEDPEDATLQQILTALEYEGETADPS